MEGPTARCHCGKVTIRLARTPETLTECNCSLCRSYGVRWAYLPAADIVVDAAATDTYAWNGRHVDFHRCAECGCVTHWMPRDRDREQRGINARLLPAAVTDGIRVRHLDGADTGRYLD